MKISELAVRTGLSAHTIRYYERIGLMPPAPRDGATHRHYDERALNWIEFVGRLKTTGMPIRQMLRYAELRAAGPSSNAERKALLTEHRDAVRRHVEELIACLEVLDAKIAGYDD